MVILLNACSFHSPKSQFYVMNSDGLTSVSDKKIGVAVSHVQVPDMLDKSQMVVYDKDSSEVRIMEFHRWAEVLPDVIQTTVANDLIVYLPNSYVQRTFFDSDALQYGVNIEVNRLEAYEDDKVVLSVWWNICNSKGKILRREQRTYTAKTKGSGIPKLVEAQADAVHKMSRDIAETLLQL